MNNQNIQYNMVFFSRQLHIRNKWILFMWLCFSTKQRAEIVSQFLQNPSHKIELKIPPGTQFFFSWNCLLPWKNVPVNDIVSVSQGSQSHCLCIRAISLLAEMWVRNIVIRRRRLPGFVIVTNHPRSEKITKKSIAKVKYVHDHQRRHESGP